MNTISSSKSSSLETSAKLIADAAEKEYVTETILETLDPSQEIRCSDVTKINNTDYSSCSITFDEQGKAYVTIVGSGKFDGLRVCDATKEDATATDQGICATPASCFVAEDYIEYTIKNYDSCVSYLTPKYVTEWGNQVSDLQQLCRGEGLGDYANTSEVIRDFLYYEGYTKEELINNNVINAVDNGNLEITGYSTNCTKDVVIPSKINNKTVTVIGNGAFTINMSFAFNGEENNKNNDILLLSNKNTLYNNQEPQINLLAVQQSLGITSVVIPSTVTTIGFNAFYNNQISGELDLTNLVNLKNIGVSAFLGNQITSVKLPNNLESIGNNAFSGNTLTSISVGNTSMVIGACSFGSPLPEDNNLSSEQIEACDCGTSF